MSFILGTAVTLVAVAYSQDAVARCGPWYANQACPFNANGLGGELHCTRFGFCSSAASDGSNGVYVKMDGDCVNQADMNGYCNSQLAGSTCSFAEKRCQISGQDPKMFDGLARSGSTAGTGTTGTPTTPGNIDSSTAPVATSSSSTPYPLMMIVTIMALVAAAVHK